MQEQKKKVGYLYAGKEPLGEIIRQAFPRNLKPTKKTNTYLGIIFLAVLALAFVQFPYSSLMTGNTNIVINVGYPWPLLKFSLIEIESNPLQIKGLILDVILYILIAYIADIATNLLLKNPLIISKEDSKKQPKVFEDKKARTVAEKLTKKVAEKTSPTIPDKINNPQNQEKILPQN